MNFDYATVQSSVAAIFGANQDIGKGVADLLVDKLVNDGTYSVIERKMLDKIIAEQNFSNSDRADATSTARIGKMELARISAVSVAAEAEASGDSSEATAVSKNNSKAVVAITARMISTGRGESSRSGANLTGAGGSAYGVGAGGLDMNASNFANTILGEAVRGAVDSTAQQLEARAGALPMMVLSIEGLVADASPDGTLIINVGSESGLKVGDKLVVKRVGRKISDPATGKVLRHIENLIGHMTITEVDARSAMGKFSGSVAPKVGDAVRNQ